MAKKRIIKLMPDMPVPEVVEALEGLLDRAKAGEIVAIAYVVQSLGGNSGSGWTACNNVHYLKSGVMTLFTRLSLFGLDD